VNALLLAFPGCGALTRRLSEGLASASGRVEWRHFPDGESLVALDGECAGRDVVIVATLRDPDRLALPLLFAARTARELGARSVGLVAPYLGYMRQDARFAAGQAVSSTHFCAFLAWIFDWLVTVDPHLHRRHDLGALTDGRAEAVSSVPLVAEWIRGHVADPVLIGPDAESAQWLEPLAHLTGAPLVVLDKERRGDRDVRVSEPSSAALLQRTPVLFDDIVSTGQTMIQTLARLRDGGAKAPVCIAVHGIFAGDAERWLRVAGATGIVTTSTIEHATNAIDVAPALLPAVARRLRSR
jgi:ribose-phosphate pyrophosphokinase